MSDDRKSFSVKDRRLFTPDGDARRSDEAAPVETPSEADSPTHVDATAPIAEPSQDDRPELPVDFATFLASLASQGLQALVVEPPALREARAMISVLEMLRDKTQGRRSTEEDEIVEGLLYQLRMAYLARTKAGA